MPGQKSADLPPNLGRDAYQQIVQNQCVTNWLQHNDPSPCEKVFLADAKPDSTGYALLADPDGGAHYLLIPTQTKTRQLSAASCWTRVWTILPSAWRGRDLLSKYIITARLCREPMWALR